MTEILFVRSIDDRNRVCSLIVRSILVFVRFNPELFGRNRKNSDRNPSVRRRSVGSIFCSDKSWSRSALLGHLLDSDYITRTTSWSRSALLSFPGHQPGRDCFSRTSSAATRHSSANTRSQPDLLGNSSAFLGPAIRLLGNSRSATRLTRSTRHS